MLDLVPNHLQIVRDILATHVPNAEVRAFGSRVKGCAKSYSDLDLAIIEEKKISFDRFRLLKESFQNSELPMRVDLVDWHGISDSFQKIIESGFVKIWPLELE
ncbi:MAG: uncharacterized protein PWR01_1954 [Clostridiales bacterium]|jgi:predicted nucleotidyltransferase|nr:uncharacterized protein [Clostridiales bacterium]MDN5280881.1 uncharacterized protein [Candidatus Ozemobacter sp.]